MNFESDFYFIEDVEKVLESIVTEGNHRQNSNAIPVEDGVHIESDGEFAAALGSCTAQCNTSTQRDGKVWAFVWPFQDHGWLSRGCDSARRKQGCETETRFR